MANKGAYAAALQINDRLVEVYRSIDWKMALKEEPEVRTSLLEICSSLRGALDKHGALTPKRAADLAAVADETAQAEEAALAGKHSEVFAALSRAHGRIVKVMVDVMTKMG